MINLYFRVRAFAIRCILPLLPFKSPIIFKGVGAGEQLCAQISTLGLSRLLIVTDEVLRSVGVLDELTKALDAGGVSYAIYDGILPDPTFTQVTEGVSRLEACSAQGILAVGGGSVLDAAKMISLLQKNPGPLESFLPLQRAKYSGIPVFAIPTTAGTGSEITPYAIITDAQSHKKTAVIDTKMMPEYIALDAGIMRSMPAGITAATGMDALTHAVESYVNRASNEATELQAEAAVRLIFTYLPRAYRDGSDLEARGSLALASNFAGAAFSRTTVGYVHSIAHQLGRLCGTPHGNANAMVLPEVLMAYGDCVHGRLAQLARRTNIGDAALGDSALAQDFIARVTALRAELDLPLKPRELKESDIADIVKEAIWESGELYPVPRYLSAGEITSIVQGLLPSASAT